LATRTTPATKPLNPANPHVNPFYPEASAPKMAINEFVNLVLDMIEDGEASDPKTRQLFQACRRMEGNYRTAGDVSAAGLSERMNEMAEENEELNEELTEEEQKELQEEQAEAEAERQQKREEKQYEEMPLSQLKQKAREEGVDTKDLETREEIAEAIKEAKAKKAEESEQEEGESESEDEEESDEPPTDEELETMSADQLKEYCKENEIEIDDDASKEEMVSAIKEHNQS